MKDTLAVGKDYRITVKLIDPWTHKQYTHECLAEVIDWFANGPHFYFDDGYGLETFIQVNSEQIISFAGKEVVVVNAEVVVVNAEFDRQLCF